MSWRNGLRVEHSNAEEMVYSELVKLGLRPDRDQVIPLTKPDFFFNEVRPRGMASFLDGVPLSKTGKQLVHGSQKSEKWEELVNRVLEHLGVEYNRFRYKPPMGIRKAREVAYEIREAYLLLPKRY